MPNLFDANPNLDDEELSLSKSVFTNWIKDTDEIVENLFHSDFAAA
jgi:hypothetical protein